MRHWFHFSRQSPAVGKLPQMGDSPLNDECHRSRGKIPMHVRKRIYRENALFPRMARMKMRRVVLATVIKDNLNSKKLGYFWHCSVFLAPRGRPRQSEKQGKRMRLYSIEIRNPNPKWSFDWGAHAPGAWPLHPQSAIPYPFPVLTLDASRLHWPVKCEATSPGSRLPYPISRPLGP